ncbi:hypothetical protein PAMA_013122 [Pampus argenteus]
MVPCLEDEGCDLLVNKSGWTCTQPGGRVKTTTCNQEERRGEERSGEERRGAERRGAERSGEERRGEERRGEERRGEERRGEERTYLCFAEGLPPHPSPSPPPPSLSLCFFLSGSLRTHLRLVLMGYPNTPPLLRPPCGFGSEDNSEDEEENWNLPADRREDILLALDLLADHFSRDVPLENALTQHNIVEEDIDVDTEEAVANPVLTLFRQPKSIYHYHHHPTTTTTTTTITTGPPKPWSRKGRKQHEQLQSIMGLTEAARFHYGRGPAPELQDRTEPECTDHAGQAPISLTRLNGPVDS